jgi:hypothetical protein
VLLAGQEGEDETHAEVSMTASSRSSKLDVGFVPLVVGEDNVMARQ